MRATCQRYRISPVERNRQSLCTCALTVRSLSAIFRNVCTCAIVVENLIRVSHFVVQTFCYRLFDFLLWSSIIQINDISNCQQCDYTMTAENIYFVRRTDRHFMHLNVCCVLSCCFITIELQA